MIDASDAFVESKLSLLSIRGFVSAYVFNDDHHNLFCSLHCVADVTGASMRMAVANILASGGRYRQTRDCSTVYLPP